ncbi:MAG: Protein translocase subunit SecD [Candidatus Moranbacteria bacterium GW2011_GWF2_36_839]|nr:MAG: Protein translocase subunit SecD [Candidatus Moranbacteria bacterium GW2011_GWF1_36_78]KKQ16537.1 MAG: Protein translocase subunit SecD [Candidatus Moranbacteria bacterium GW2011_GWF2_36_839]HAT73499.1 protein translocase subunit SecD [Candidatus Moranbacteria bacterium]HBY10861.1 protein translocase subunit SecD [Candidatus Moranbacteria bacterium]
MNVRQKLRLKFGAVVILAILAGLISYPQAVSKIPKLYDFFNKPKINLGLDLQGGIHLEYKADLSQVDPAKQKEAMQAMQDAVERKINAFGVAEPVIYTTKSGDEQRLIVELAGIRDINEAKKRIGEMPFLEFKEEEETAVEKIPEDILNKTNETAKNKAQDLLKKALAGEDFAKLAKENSEDPGSKEKGGEYDFVKKGMFVPEYEAVIFDKGLKDGEIYKELVETQFGWHIIKRIEVKPASTREDDSSTRGGGEGDPAKSPDGDSGASNQEFKSAHILIAKKVQPEPKIEVVTTGLTGKNLKSASVGFQNQGLTEPVIDLEFDEEGTKLFAEITKRNIGKRVAILIDGEIITNPTVNSEIPNGKAQITGSYTTTEANELVKRLNEGALPVPIGNPINQQSVEASLGKISLEKSLKAGMIGMVLVIIFMLLFYRFLGLVASFSLLIYSALMISIFKLSGFSPWQITLTLPGIAGFVLSIGMAVDANILIFERTKEEIKKGRDVLSAIEEGFKRAWTSIRDGNMSSIITAFILIEMGTGFVKGFAVTLIIGVIVSMFTAVVITRTILRFVMGRWLENKLWLIGVNKKPVITSEAK